LSSFPRSSGSFEPHPQHPPFYSKCIDNAGNLEAFAVSCSKINPHAERMWFMSSVPAPADPGWDEDPAWLDRDPMTAGEREAWLDRLCEQDDDPFDQPGEYWDPESTAPPPGQDELTAGEVAGIREAAADEMLALDAASTGRRGPGHPGSARTFPGESDSRAAGFGTGDGVGCDPGLRPAGRGRRCRRQRRRPG
jgi:hypothetical protein